jgi:hypothetical protein
LEQLDAMKGKRAHYKLAACALAFLFASTSLYASDDCAPILKAAQIAREDFASRLKEFEPVTEFDRVAGNIDNYDVGLSGAGGSYVVVFKLKEMGAVVKGGGAIYVVRKRDLAIVKFIGQE